jgi:hypothetical protein
LRPRSFVAGAVDLDDAPAPERVHFDPVDLDVDLGLGQARRARLREELVL